MTEQWSSAGEPEPVPIWVDVDDEPLAADERSSSYPPDSLVTFRFLWDAVRRHVRLWLAIALLGLAVGLAIPVVLPPASAASARLLLTHREGDEPVRAMATDVSLVTTRTVAQGAIDRLGLTETPDELLTQYTVVPLTDRVLEITANAPSSAQATELANTLANVYLSFRSDQIALQMVPVQDQFAAARAAVAAAEADVVAAGGDPNDPDPPPSSEVNALNRAREKQAFIRQQVLDQEVAGARMSSSRMLDAAAPVPSSARRTLVINIGSGLVAGLFLGVGFVIVRALVSDRLWKRQDIARALGARIRLSVGTPPRWRWGPLPRYVRRSLMQKATVRLAVRHLRESVVWGEASKPALAIVSIDSAQASALIVAALAMSYAEEGKRVLVADLSGSGDLAAALGVTSIGTHESRAGETGASVTVHLPNADAGPPEGRLLHVGNRTAADDEALVVAWAVADIVLTLATLSPALGGEHLQTWASHATAVVTAGRSTAAKLHAAGEMVRLGGVRLDSAVLLRADRTDESVGVMEGQSPSAKAKPGFEMIGR